MHRSAQVAETTVGCTHHQERCLQHDLAVVDVELGVGRHRVADHRVTAKICQRISGIAQIVGGELTCPAGSNTYALESPAHNT